MVQTILSIIRRMGIYDTKLIMWIRSIAFKVVGRNLRKYGEEALQKFKECAESTDSDYWIDFGTLLGIYRDGKLIDHDADIDVSIFKDDERESLKKAMEKVGFKKVKEFTIGEEVVEETFMYKGVQMDIFYYYKDKDKVYGHAFYCDTKLELCTEGNKRYTTGWKAQVITNKIQGFAKIDFNGNKYRVPKNTHEYLSENYGPNYMIKDKFWNPDKAPNIIYKDIKNIRCNLYK